MPEHGYKNNLIVAVPVIVVTMFLIVIFCLIIICHRTASKEGKEGSSRGFFSTLWHKKCSLECKMEEGDFWRSLRDMYRPRNTIPKKNVAQELQDKDLSDEDEFFDKMYKGETSTSTARIATSDSTANETGEESGT